MAAARASLGVAAAVFMIVLGARFALIDAYGNPLPYWDQWDAQARDLVIPYAEGSLRVGDLFEPHNEHRIVPTKLLNLALLAANETWEPRLEMVAGAFVHGLSAALVAAFLVRRMRGLARATFLGFLVVAFSAPFSWYNTVNGFQSQFYFLELATLIAIAATFLVPRPSAGPSTARAIAGVLASVFAALSMGSGLLAPLAIAVVAGAIAIASREGRRAYRRVAVLQLLVALAFLLAREEGAAPLDLTSIAGVEQFFVSLGRTLAWPFVELPWLAFAWLAPFVALALLLIYDRMKPGGEEASVLALGLWTFLQALAMAYVRGHGGAPPPSRYLDILALGEVSLALAIWLLVRRLEGRAFAIASALGDCRCASRSRLAAPAGLAAFVVALALSIGMVRFTRVHMRSSFLALEAEIPEQVLRCRSYLATRDLGTLQVGVRPGSIPYPDSKRLALYLSTPSLQPYLPIVLREPPSGPDIDWRRSEGRLASASEALLDAAWWLVAIGAAGLVAMGVGPLARLRRSRKDPAASAMVEASPRPARERELAC